MNRLAISVDRFWRIFVYNFIACQLHKQNLRNLDFKLAQPVNSELCFSYEVTKYVQQGLDLST